MELSTLEEAEHQFLIDPFDRSVALVFQMFQSSDLDPWDVDLSSFIEMFNQKIDRAENIDLPSLREADKDGLVHTEGAGIISNT